MHVLSTVHLLSRVSSDLSMHILFLLRLSRPAPMVAGLVLWVCSLDPVNLLVFVRWFSLLCLAFKRPLTYNTVSTLGTSHEHKHEYKHEHKLTVSVPVQPPGSVSSLPWFAEASPLLVASMP